MICAESEAQHHSRRAGLLALAARSGAQHDADLDFADDHDRGLVRPAAFRMMVLRLPRSDYLTACARIRGINPTSLIRRLIQVIDQDQLVASILDDAEQIKQRHKSERRYQEA